MAIRRHGGMVIGLTIFALIDGFVIGLIAGIFAQTAAASPPGIDSNEYVWLVSVDYAAAGDLQKAVQRLSVLQPAARQLPVLVRRVVRQAETRHDTPRVTLLVRLANALAEEESASVEAEIVGETETPTAVVASAHPLPPVGKISNQGSHPSAGIPASAGSTSSAERRSSPP